MKRKRLTSEIRFRVSKQDLERINWLLERDQYRTVSSLLRSMIYEEWCRSQTPDKEK
jgi:hypothetical protein